MQNNKRKHSIVGFFILLIVGLVSVLFSEDLSALYYETMAKYQASSGAAVHVIEGAIVPGYVEYISEEDTEREIVYPKLSNVRATLSIPGHHISGSIVNGTTEDAMNQGFWHYPSASPFAKTGNVVIFGHRYLKIPPHSDTFYNLDKVKKGDQIVITSVFENVTYRVDEVKIVDSHDHSIVAQTEESIITLVTCHPLWTSKQRLVVIGTKL